MKVDVLAFGAHPDDIELSCCGTLMNAVDAGKSIGLVDLTQGEMGTRGSAELRLSEARNSAKLMGASFRHNLSMRDGFFEINDQNLRLIVEQIRFSQPSIVLANSESDRHPDHGRAAELVHRACFLSGLQKYETSWNGKEQVKWRPTAVYHYVQDRNLEPDIVVDISKNFAKKIECLKCFASQFHDPNSKEPETPLTSHDFFDFIAGKAKTYGRHIHAEYAEMFTSKRYIGVDDITKLQ
jgi:bacillithiol biosynthesis deacetylase BshB1